ncbi:MAG: hypothetical protein ACKO2Z_04315 [Sphaerospermopsis kisseleviana]
MALKPIFPKTIEIYHSYAINLPGVIRINKTAKTLISIVIAVTTTDNHLTMKPPYF